MTKEDIDKAAVDSCVIENDIFNPQLTPYYEQGFKDGANWRINSVWHDARKELPEHKAAIIEYQLISGENGYLVVEDPKEIAGCIIRYAYLDDLIPERKEETK